MTIGENVRTRREENGFSREQLAAASSISRGAIDLLEQGYTIRPRPATLKALADALGCKVADLANGARQPLPAERDAERMKAHNPAPTTRVPMRLTEQELLLLREFRLMPFEAQRDLVCAVCEHNSAEFFARAEKRRGRLL